ncbi:MAG: threonine/serine dehydratase [Gemmatimonadota bacterium]|nr:threonine/serine dehydratase [Gemmatimonadota bacterium]
MITLEEIEQAMMELPSDLVNTPALHADAISNETGATVLLKTENLQVTGSYKSRAAFTILNRLSDEQKQRGAAISSSGNFAAAFAYMGTLLEVPTAVVMMRKTSLFKVERTRGFGAEVVLCENHNKARWDTLDRLEQERGLAAINTWEDADVVRGHGTIGIEILEQAPDVDIVIVPVSSSGLIAGIATAVKSLRPSVKVIGVQPEGSQAVFRSFHEGAICEVEEPETICDALIAARPGALPFDHVRQYVDDVVLVSDEQAKDAIRILASTTKLVAEPGGAVSVAAVLSGDIDVRGKTVVSLVSGGNIAMSLLAEILSCES